MNIVNKKIPFSVSLVVPVFNCKKTVVSQLNICNKILKTICKNYEIVVSDDCSTDGTAKLLKVAFKDNRNFRLIFQKKNLGIGKNFKFLYISANKEYVMTFPADGDYEPYDIKKMLMFCAAKKGDLIIGKRIKKGGYTIYRKIVSRLFRLLPLLFFGIDTIDAGSIKLINRKIFAHPIVSESVFVEAEIIITARRKGYRVLSCPIFYGKPEKLSGVAGKFSLATDAFWDLIKFRLYGSGIETSQP